MKFCLELSNPPCFKITSSDCNLRTQHQHWGEGCPDRRRPRARPRIRLRRRHRLRRRLLLDQHDREVHWYSVTEPPCKSCFHIVNRNCIPSESSCREEQAIQNQRYNASQVFKKEEKEESFSSEEDSRLIKCSFATFVTSYIKSDKQ